MARCLCRVVLVLALWIIPPEAMAFLISPKLIWDNIVVNDMTLDSHCNIYIAGRAFDPNSKDSNHDVGTVKYDSKGNLLWKRRYDGPQEGFDYAEAISLDANGNVYVLGCVQLTPKGTKRWGGFVKGYVLVKYSSEGKVIWNALYKDPKTSNDSGHLTVGPQGCCYVTGRSGRDDDEDIDDDIGDDIVTIKYDSNGKHVWTVHYQGPNNDSSPSDILVDKKQNVYVIGSSYGKYRTYDVVIIKYDSSGQQLWTVRLGGEPDKQYWPGDLALDSHGNIYAAVNYNNRQDRPRVVICKYDADGRLLWQRTYRRKQEDAWTYDMLVGSGGDVHVAVNTDKRLMYVKYDADGFRLSAVGHKGDISGFYRIFVDDDGDIFLNAIAISDTSFGAEGMLMKIDSQGAWCWTKMFGTPAEFAQVRSGD